MRYGDHNNGITISRDIGPLIFGLKNHERKETYSLEKGQISGGRKPGFWQTEFLPLPITGGFDENGCESVRPVQGGRIRKKMARNNENGESGACHACTGPVCRKP